ncbi:hypothetical protein HanIR_Chr07g0336751 [Helianthus annuus]|nr:hypothetical protein HanIR_Chr07g0336751 [Helianthus annuus]
MLGIINRWRPILYFLFIFTSNCCNKILKNRRKQLTVSRNPARVRFATTSETKFTSTMNNLSCCDRQLPHIQQICAGKFAVKKACTYLKYTYRIWVLHRVYALKIVVE